MAVSVKPPWFHTHEASQHHARRPVLDNDQRFSATLTKPGTYDYFCSLHPKMQGKIIVRR